MTLKLILAFVIAFAVSAVVGFFLVPYLKRIKAGQSIKENGPTWHMSKQGTPTMGGLMFIAAIAVVCLSVGFECMAEGEYGHLFCLAFALVFGAIGFASVANTFCHIRAHFLVSLLRTGIGLVLGLVLGAIVLLILRACWPISSGSTQTKE